MARVSASRENKRDKDVYRAINDVIKVIQREMISSVVWVGQISRFRRHFFDEF